MNNLAAFVRGGGFGLELGSCPVSPLDFGITRFYGCLRKRCVQLGPQVLADNSAHRPYYVLLRGMGMAEKTDVWQGTLALMVLKTLEVMGPIHGYGIARRIEPSVAELLQPRATGPARPGALARRPERLMDAGIE